MTNFKLLFLFSYLVLISCAPIQIIEDHQETSLSSLNKATGLNLDLGRLNNLELLNNPSLKTKPFPMTYNNRVKYWINYYSIGKGKSTMKMNLERLGRYGNYMGSILIEEGLPPQLVYVAMVESAFNTHLKSPKNALGYWQFIPSTARLYDLTVNSKLDERKDFALSTRAAAKYYKDLYNQYTDWHLSMAGYNCGEGCVNEAIRRYGTKDFWTLASKKALPAETRNFVPKIIAMAHIGQSPSSYGFHNINYQRPLDYDLYELKGHSHYHLSSLSKQLDIPINQLKYLNPRYKTDSISTSNAYIRVPASL